MDMLVRRGQRMRRSIQDAGEKESEEDVHT